MGFTAIIIGATGLTGKALLDLLLENENYDQVITLSRKRATTNNDKHTNYVVDLFEPKTYTSFLKGNHLFICTGTTKSKTPDKDEYYRIEHDLPVVVSETALQNGVQKVIAISSLGADPNSSIDYNRGKGAMEKDIEAMAFKKTYFVQPALIGGERDEKRGMESFMKSLMYATRFLMVGFLKKYQIIEPVTIAKSMIYIAIHDYPINRIESDELQEIAKKY